MSRSKYNLAICDIYHPNLHGINDDTFYTHNIVRYNIRLNKFYTSYNNILNSYNRYILNNIIPHPYIRNYIHIINNRSIKNIDIIELIEIIDQEGFNIMCAIKKTLWLKIIQRKWRKIYKLRKDIIQYRKNINNIFYYQKNGRWEKYNYIPTIYGMLNDL